MCVCESVCVHLCVCMCVSVCACLSVHFVEESNFPTYLYRLYSGALPDAGKIFCYIRILL